MDREAFWKLIESTRKKSGRDPDDQMDAIRDALRKLAPDEIVSFDHHYTDLWADAYRWDVWQAAYVAGGGCSDDSFMDFRYWLIARGRKVYEAVLKDPEYLAKILEDGDEGQVEGFQYIAPEVWQEKTGLDRYTDFPERPDRLPTEPAGERRPDEQLPRRFPKLWKKFGDQF